MRNYLYFRKLQGIYSGASACKSMELRTHEKLREQHRINSQLTAFFEITRGCSLLTLTGVTAPSHAQDTSLTFGKFYPTSKQPVLLVYILFSRRIIQWNNLPASVFSEHCSLDTFKAHVSCPNHLPVYQPNKLTFLFLNLFFIYIYFLLTNPANYPQMIGTGCIW